MGRAEVRHMVGEGEEGGGSREREGERRKWGGGGREGEGGGGREGGGPSQTPLTLIVLEEFLYFLE
jgi:hypothetical protein